MTKRELIEKLKNIPDGAVVVFFNGDEELQVANDVILHNPTDHYYYVPECLEPQEPVWMEVGYVKA